MNEKDQKLLLRLLVIFKAEAEEHLQVLSSTLFSLEKTSEPGEQVNLTEILFRETHSFKGSARSVNLLSIERICQELESIFSALKGKKLTLTLPLFDLLHHAVDELQRLVETSNEPTESSSIPPRLMTLIQNLRNASNNEVVSFVKSAPMLQEETPKPSREPSHLKEEHSSKTVRVSLDHLNSVMLQVEEMRLISLNAHHQMLNLNALLTRVQHWEKSSQKTHPGEDEMFKELKKEVQFLHSSSKRDLRYFQQMLDHISTDIRALLMVPFSSFLESYYKMTRDLSRAQGKEIEFSVQGAEIEIDRRILEEMRDPFNHIVRNCIDHGIESPQDRLSHHKLATGKLSIQVSTAMGGKIEVVISDDGSGVDLERLKKAVVKSGLLAAEKIDTLSEKELLSFIFKSGLSTASEITEYSGRGIGLAIVEDKIAKLGGSISVDSKPQSGTTFRILLPMTLVTLRGILIEVWGKSFALPTTHVEKVLKVCRETIKTVENREMITIAGQHVALISLGTILQLPDPSDEAESSHITVVILLKGDQRIGFQIDSVVTEQEILVKNLGKQLKRIPYVSGVTILGTGKVVPILNVSDLIDASIHTQSQISQSPTKSVAPISSQKKSLLVVDDSVTTRTLMQSILELTATL